MADHEPPLVLDAREAPLTAQPQVAILLVPTQTQGYLSWIELHEAFAAQALAVTKDIGLDPDSAIIALGHPLGTTGAVRVAVWVRHRLSA